MSIGFWKPLVSSPPNTAVKKTPGCDLDGTCRNCRKRYQRRLIERNPRLYELVNPDVCMTIQEKERALVRWIHKCNIQPLGSKRVLDVGCGTGKTLAQFLRLGFEPENLVGSELLRDRLEIARKYLPTAVDLRLGDAAELDAPDESFDIVAQSTVFTFGSGPNLSRTS